VVGPWPGVFLSVWDFELYLSVGVIELTVVFLHLKQQPVLICT
jgi:hypothetical protein